MNIYQNIVVLLVSQWKLAYFWCQMSEENYIATFESWVAPGLYLCIILIMPNQYSNTYYISFAIISSQ